MRIPIPGLKHAILVAAVALGLGGCVYPAPGYGYYQQPYYPYYYGPPVAGAVVIGGGGYHHWR
jgi:hypothetical protein